MLLFFSLFFPGPPKQFAIIPTYFIRAKLIHSVIPKYLCNNKSGCVYSTLEGDGRQKDLEGIKLSETSQSENSKCYMVHSYVESNEQNELICEIETDS